MIKTSEGYEVIRYFEDEETLDKILNWLNIPKRNIELKEFKEIDIKSFISFVNDEPLDYSKLQVGDYICANKPLEVWVEKSEEFSSKYDWKWYDE